MLIVRLSEADGVPLLLKDRLSVEDKLDVGLRDEALAVSDGEIVWLGEAERLVVVDGLMV